MAHTLPVPVGVAGGVSSVRRGILLGLASAVTFASSGSFLKPLLEAGWTPGAAALWRMAGAALVLLPVLVVALRRDPGLLRRHGALILGFAATGVVGCQVLHLSAIERMPVAVALLLPYLPPALIVAWIWARTRRAPRRSVLAGTAASVCGLILVIDLSGASFDPIGVGFALGAAVSMAVYYQLSEHAGEGIAPLTLVAAGMAAGAVITGLLCLAGLLPYAAPPVSVPLGGMVVPWFVPLGWVAVVATAVAYSLSVLAVLRIGARLAAFVGLAEVLFAVLFAWILLAEAPTLVQAAGGVLIVAGVVLVRAGTPSPDALAMPSSPSP